MAVTVVYLVVRACIGQPCTTLVDNWTVLCSVIFVLIYFLLLVLALVFQF